MKEVPMRNEANGTSALKASGERPYVEKAGPESKAEKVQFTSVRINRSIVNVRLPTLSESKALDKLTRYAAGIRGTVQVEGIVDI
jgi:hypothetical protein